MPRAEVVMLAPRDVEMVRDELLHRRDQVVLGMGTQPLATGNSHSKNTTDADQLKQSIAEDVRGLRAAVERIELYLGRKEAKCVEESRPDVAVVDKD